MKAYNGNYTHYVEVEGHEYELELTYTYYPPYKGAREGGQQIEPDEPEVIEIGSCKVDVGYGLVDFPLTKALEDEIIEEILCSNND